MIKHIATAVLLLLMYISNYLGSATSLLGDGMHDLGVTFPISFMPPGIVFSVVWMTIFVLVGIFFVHMWIRHKKSPSIHDDRELIYFGLAAFLNIIWVLLTANHLYKWAIVAIFALLVVLFLMLLLIREKKENQREYHDTWLKFDEITRGIYYGWIAMATIVLSISQILILTNNTFVYTDVWIYIILGIGAAFALISQYFTKNWIAAAISWAVIIIMLLTPFLGR